MGSLVEFKKDYYNKQSNRNEIPSMIAHKYNMVACLKWTENKQVYLIEGKTDSKKYIIKCCSNKSTEKLEEEFNLHYSLSYRGLVPAVEFIKGEGQNYFIREYVEGYTITDMVETTRAGYLSEDKVTDITLQLCDILNYLHTQTPPIIHRDIKPDNIIYTKQGECKLIDFGISRRYSNEQENDTHVLGTRYAAPPEQYGFRQTDARSDVYSIGVLMFYMATGSLDMNEFDRYSISTRLKKSIKKCTEFAPENRYQSVKQLEVRLSKNNLLLKKKLLQVIGAGSILFVILLVSKLLASDIVTDERTEISNNEISKTDIINNEISKNEIINNEISSDDLSNELSLDAEYEFTSPMIEAAVRHELGLSEAEHITIGDLNRVEELYLCGEQSYDSWDQHFVYGKMQYMKVSAYNQSGLFQNQGDIEVLDDLILMKNLHTLALYNQKITDITPLRELTNLTSLGLGANNIEDITAIEGLIKLTTLDLSGNPLEDSDMLSLPKLPNLVNLDLGDTKITSLNVVKEIKLKSLSVYNVHLQDCEGIETMTSLEKLITTGVNNTITEQGLENIVKLTNLKELKMLGGEFSDLSILTKLTSLTFLDLCACKIDSLEELRGMKLTTLFFDLTQVTDLSAIKEFKELTTVGIRNIPCTDYTPLMSLPLLKYINCNQEQVETINKQMEGNSYEFWIL